MITYTGKLITTSLISNEYEFDNVRKLEIIRTQKIKK
jgi:hypothetical protein